MKVNNIQPYNPVYNAQKGAGANPPQKAQKNGNPAFKGALAINFWDAIARGGFAASFTVQDMTGTNFPRTYQALQRNKDLTGKNNYKAATEVAIREFLTGPSMCIIPMVILAASKRFSGTANEIPMENIAPFADEMKVILKKGTMKHVDVNTPKTLPKEYAAKAKTKFYERMFALALDEDMTRVKVPSDNAKELAQMLQQYDAAPKRNVIKQIFNINLTQKSIGASSASDARVLSKDQIFDKMVTKFTDCKKHITDDYTTLLTTDMCGKLDKPNSIKTLIKDISNFGNDVEKTMGNCASKSGSISSVGLNFSSFMDEFKTARTGSKFLTNVLMVVATGLFMMKIPQLYTLYKTNPETDAFRNENGEVVRANQ